MIWRIAWRNIRSRKRQSRLTIGLSLLCTVFLIFGRSFMDGEHAKMIRDAVEIYTGYIQITAEGFREYPDYDHLIYDVGQVRRIVQAFPEIEAATPRFETFALFAVNEDSAAGMLIGIDPGPEQRLSRIQSAVSAGAYLAVSDQPQCLVGKKLAERLNIRCGDRLTYLSEAVDRSTAADILTVTGIFSTGSQMDERVVFVNKRYMDGVFLSQNTATQYVLLPTPRYRGGRLAGLVNKLNRQLAGTKTGAVSWNVPLKSLVELIAVDSVFGYFSYGILVGVVFFVIMIFSLIGILQRTREIGILRAVGTRPRRIFGMLLAEALILGGISVVVGGLVGGALIYHYYVHPIHFTVSQDVAEQYQRWGVTDMTFPTLFSAAEILGPCVFMLVLHIAAVVYPAIHVNRYQPVEAINYV